MAKPEGMANKNVRKGRISVPRLGNGPATRNIPQQPNSAGREKRSGRNQSGSIK